jgi:hypothetical protein
MLTTHKKARKNILVFSKFCKFLFCFLLLQNFVLFQIQDTRYLSWESSRKLASGSVLLVGVVRPLTEVSPPLLLLLQLPLLYRVDPLTGGLLPYLGGLDMLV